MEIFLGWIIFAVIVGVAANTRGRNGFGWFLIALVTSPLIGGLLLLALPRVEPTIATNEPYPWEKELSVQVEQPRIPTTTPSAFQADGVYGGIPYRVLADGTVEAAMPTGIIRFRMMDHFIAAATGRTAENNNLAPPGG